MKKVILIAYDLNPKIGSESGVASIWLRIIAKHYLVDVSSDGTIVTTRISVNIGDVAFTKLFAFATGSNMTVTVFQRIEPIVL